MPDAKSDTYEKKSLKQSKNIDKGRSFVDTNFREAVECDTCGAVCFIYSDHAVGEKKGPTKKLLEDLVNSLEKEYVCSNSINNNAGLFVKRQLRCGDYI